MLLAGLLLAVAGLPIALASVYLLILAVASFHRQRRATGDGRTRLAVLVPAHDEEDLIARCVRSLSTQTYPRNLYRIVVIADNCTDTTASVAAAGGAEVLIRQEPNAFGKGHALRWAMDKLLAGHDAPDGVVVVDADSVAHPELLNQLAGALERGADAGQAEYLILAEDDTIRTRLLAAAFLLFHRVRLGGRATLGLPASLVGNGMIFSRRLLETIPWNAFTGVEDLEYTVNLRLAGFRPVFVSGARVGGPVPRGYRGQRGQRLRWEGGRWHVVRNRLWQLTWHSITRDWRVIDAALDLAIPPLGLLAMCGLAGSAVAAAAVVFNLAPAWSLPSWLLAMVAMTAFVVLGLLSARAPVSTWLALVESPRFLIFKALTYVRIAAGLDPLRWDRSARDVTGPAPVQQRVEVAGVPIDRVDMAAAIGGLRETLANGRHVQVATVNLDFLVRAQRDSALMDVLRQTELNVADGMPVVWLSRLMGHGVPERVAGADLVPNLVREAAASGQSVFLLGGQDGAAEASVRRLRQELPQLTIAGWHEPPAARLKDMNHEQLVRMINDSGADVLLVAFGNPKQEFWIARNRRRLPGVKVAIGVGCVFDIWSERVERAPAWMQRSGLEWLHRLNREPRRLAGRFVTDAAWLPVLATRVAVDRVRPATSPRSAAAR